MATVEELKAAAAEEKAEVAEKLNELTTLVQELKDQIAAGTGAITEAQLDEVLEAIKNIHTPSETA